MYEACDVNAIIFHTFNDLEIFDSIELDLFS